MKEPLEIYQCLPKQLLKLMEFGIAVHNVQIVQYLFLATELGEIDVTCPYCWDPTEQSAHSVRMCSQTHQH